MTMQCGETLHSYVRLARMLAIHHPIQRPLNPYDQ
uniref:Uncharacterized protein n=1 Tax=Anguilla anguilla TaxID=7936 RepID=A0A0E9SN25_ANGAN